MFCFSVFFSVALVLNGERAAEVVIPEKSRDVEHVAAQELVEHVRIATGVTLPIVVKESGKAVPIRLGRAARGLEISDLRVCEARGRIGSDSVDIAGVDGDGRAYSDGTPAGTLFGVYDFLETELGVRWLWPGELGTVVPRKDSIELSRREWRSSPLAFAVWRHRSVPGQGWANPANGRRFLAAQSVWLRRHRFGRCENFSQGHAFTEYYKKFGKTHPEWFNLLPDGKREPDFEVRGRPDLIAMCPTDRGFAQQVVKAAFARKNFGGVINANENDTCGKCCCARCLAADGIGNDEGRLAEAKRRYALKDRRWSEALGNTSGRYCAFYRAVYDECTKLNRRCTVMGGIYANYSQPPPKGTKLPSDILLRFCPPIMYPWTPDKVSNFKKFWSGWSETGARLMLRPNYTLDGHGYPLFYYRPFVECYDHARRNGLRAIDYDSLTGMFAANGLTTYVIAEKNTHPEKSVETLENEYISAFGDVAEKIRGYVRHFEAATGCGGNRDLGKSSEKEGGIYAEFFTRAEKVFTDDVMRRALEILADAESSTGEELTRRRIRFLRTGLVDACMVNKVQRGFVQWKKSGDSKDFASAYRELLAYRRANESVGYANLTHLTYWERRLWPTIFGMLGDGAEEIKPWMVRLAGETDDSWREVSVRRHLTDKKGNRVNTPAWYRAEFTIDESKVAKRCRLVFGAVDGDPMVWLNDVLVLRTHPVTGSGAWKAPFPVDVSGKVKAGRNRLMIYLDKHKAGPRGIHAPVFIECE